MINNYHLKTLLQYFKRVWVILMFLLLTQHVKPRILNLRQVRQIQVQPVRKYRRRCPHCDNGQCLHYNNNNNNNRPRVSDEDRGEEVKANQSAILYKNVPRENGVHCVLVENIQDDNGNIYVTSAFNDGGEICTCDDCCVFGGGGEMMIFYLLFLILIFHLVFPLTHSRLYIYLR